MTVVANFVVFMVWSDLLCNQALLDSKGIRGMADWFIIGYLKSCAYLIHGDYTTLSIGREDYRIGQGGGICLPTILKCLPNWCEDGWS